MDRERKDRFAKIFFEMQKHVDAIARIAKRENLEIVSIGVKGVISERREGRVLSSSIICVNEETDEHFSCYAYSDKSTDLLVNGDTFKTYTRS